MGRGLDCRTDERSFKALALSTNIPVRDVDGVVKRAGVEAARNCTGIASSGVSRSVSGLVRGEHGGLASSNRSGR